MSKSHKKHAEGHMDETWLIPYADLLTLLLALFIVLFSISNVDKAKMESIVQIFSAELGGTPPMGIGVGPGVGDLPPQISIPPSPTPTPAEPGGITEAEQLMASLFDSITNYIDANGLSNEMQLRLNGELLLLTLTSDIWFASGSADISEGQRDTAHKLGQLIAANQKHDMPLNIIITGHTDNVPISTSRFRSNWYLSATRAVNFMEAMLESAQLDPRSFSARGYGEYEPVDTNDTDEGRTRNRRVEVLISYNKEIKATLEEERAEAE